MNPRFQQLTNAFKRRVDAAQVKPTTTVWLTIHYEKGGRSLSGRAKVGTAYTPTGPQATAERLAQARAAYKQSILRQLDQQVGQAADFKAVDGELIRPINFELEIIEA